MKTSAQLQLELSVLSSLLFEDSTRAEKLDGELNLLKEKIRKRKISIEDTKKQLRNSQEREWTPTKKWPKDTEFYIHNLHNLVWTQGDFGKWEFSWKKQEKRWRKERTAQLHLSDALKDDPSAVLVAIPVSGENEVVPHRPVFTV